MKITKFTVSKPDTALRMDAAFSFEVDNPTDEEVHTVAWSYGFFNGDGFALSEGSIIGSQHRSGFDAKGIPPSGSRVLDAPSPRIDARLCGKKHDAITLRTVATLCRRERFLFAELEIHSDSTQASFQKLITDSTVVGPCITVMVRRERDGPDAFKTKVVVGFSNHLPKRLEVVRVHAGFVIAEEVARSTSASVGG